MLVIHSEIKRDKEFAEEERSSASGEGAKVAVEECSTLVTELSILWVGFGVMATTIQSAIVITHVFTRDPWYHTVSTRLLAVVSMSYVVSIFTQPRRRDQKTI